jgi:hypothetical protein
MSLTYGSRSCRYLFVVIGKFKYARTNVLAKRAWGRIYAAWAKVSLRQSTASSTTTAGFMTESILNAANIDRPACGRRGICTGDRPSPCIRTSPEGFQVRVGGHDCIWTSKEPFVELVGIGANWVPVRRHSSGMVASNIERYGWSGG